jgi:hypothetical protein
VLPVYLALGLHLLQTRGKDIVRIKDFRAASKDDIAAVHTMAYVKGLEKASVSPQMVVLASDKYYHHSLVTEFHLLICGFSSSPES